MPGGRRIVGRGRASVGTPLRRLQQSDARRHHQTECANDFHAENLRLNIASSKYVDHVCSPECVLAWQANGRSTLKRRPANLGGASGRAGHILDGRLVARGLRIENASSAASFCTFVKSDPISGLSVFSFVKSLVNCQPLEILGDVLRETTEGKSCFT
jgi:hypothetical protein